MNLSGQLDRIEQAKRARDWAIAMRKLCNDCGGGAVHRWDCRTLRRTPVR